MTRANVPADLVRLYDDEARRARPRLVAADLVDVALGRRLAIALADELTPAANLPALATALHAVRRRLGFAPDPTADGDLEAFLRELAGGDAPPGL